MPKAKAISVKSKKLKVLGDIQASGIRSAKEFLAMSALDMVNSFIDNSTEDFKIMCELQCSVRENNLFSYLCSE